MNVVFGRADILLDTGAHKDLVGDAWVACLDKLNQAAGLKPSVRTNLARPLTLRGVGKDTQESTREVTIPISVDGDKAVFQATLVEHNDSPTLLGPSTIERTNGFIDTRNKILISPKVEG